MKKQIESEDLIDLEIERGEFVNWEFDPHEADKELEYMIEQLLKGKEI